MFRTVPPARVECAVVAYGITDRLVACLESLMSHRSATDFTVTCVVNPTGRAAEDLSRLPTGIRVVTPESNLGWAGGLHAAREGSEAELLAWVQDDMVVLDGWLDALVEAADDLPRAAVLGSVGVDEQGHAGDYAAGRAFPVDEIDGWNATDTTRTALPDAPTVYDWVTSKGMLARLTAWDEVGGPDPRLFPLNHVDKDYCAHVRCHGWDVVLVPGARLRHAGNSSAPGPLRRFLPRWQAARLNARWGGPLAALAGEAVGTVPHECADRLDGGAARAEQLAGQQATLLLVPFNRFVRDIETDLREQLTAALQEGERARRSDEAARAALEIASAERDELARALELTRATLSWRITAPLRSVRGGMTRRGTHDPGGHR